MIPVLLQVLFILSFPQQAFSQDSNVTGPDYKEIFGGDYDFALGVINREQWMTDTLQKDGLDPSFALAIIFPELIRYSGIADYIEVKGLEVLYVQYGGDYADFSVGWFQMKPSFAERIESDILAYGLIDSYPSLKSLKPTISQTVDNRRERIIRLKDEYCQLLYLEAFVRIMDVLYPEMAGTQPSDKLIFYSTAYNTGYFKDESVIRHEITRKRFYRGIDPTSEKYSYSDISLRYYLSRKGH